MRERERDAVTDRDIESLVLKLNSTKLPRNPGVILNVSVTG